MRAGDQKLTCKLEGPKDYGGSRETGVYHYSQRKVVAAGYHQCVVAAVFSTVFCNHIRNSLVDRWGIFGISRGVRISPRGRGSKNSLNFQNAPGAAEFLGWCRMSRGMHISRVGGGECSRGY